MWLIFLLLGLGLIAVVLGVAVAAIVAIAIKLFPVILIVAGVWLLVRAIGGSGRRRDRRGPFGAPHHHLGAPYRPSHGPMHPSTAAYGQRQPSRPPQPAQQPKPSQARQPARPAPATATPPPPPPAPAPRRELPIDVRLKVEQIRRKADMLLEYADRFPPFSQDLHIVRQTAADYLPRTVDAYLNLPGITDPVIHSTGKTALDELKEQLNLLDSKLDEIAEALQKQDVDRMLANRRFLEERFRLRDESAKTGDIEAA
jgi:hypothetical protein